MNKNNKEPKKHLFEGHRETYTEAASNLDMEISKAIKPIMEKYAKLGYSIRDINYVIQAAVNDEALGILIDLASRINKKEKS